ncbi:hypothetical protein LOC67_23310 [Stieleria sp. JC731]|nr:hypothetical protein [Stieleria sp. JC731]MCC9603488.1 hypothetical protein [Stieleria sp. JC731]
MTAAAARDWVADMGFECRLVNSLQYRYRIEVKQNGEWLPIAMASQTAGIVASELSRCFDRFYACREALPGCDPAHTNELRLALSFFNVACIHRWRSRVEWILARYPELITHAECVLFGERTRCAVGDREANPAFTGALQAAIDNARPVRAAQIVTQLLQDGEEVLIGYCPDIRHPHKTRSVKATAAGSEFVLPGDGTAVASYQIYKIQTFGCIQNLLHQYV